MSFNIAELVGPYEIVEQLGRGGMATVYRAYHKALDRYVAIKVMHQAFMEDSNFLSRFQREAKVVASLDHPNIIPIYDFSEHKGQPYLVMKLVDGITLKERIENEHLSYNEILEIIESVAAALGYAHKKRILHRDIKPSNVIIASDGKIYLTDFGLARIIQSGDSSLTGDRMIGTPHYMSPEQAMSSTDLDGRTDIYSLGVMLYEMIVGRVPFTADTPFMIIHDHIYTPVEPPRGINPQIPVEVEEVLMKALAKKPADRFHNVGEMIHALRTALDQMEPAYLASYPIDSMQETQLGEVSPSQVETPPVLNDEIEFGMPPWVLEEPERVQEGTLGVALPFEHAVDAKPVIRQETKKSKRVWWIIAGILAGLILILCMLVGINQAQKIYANQQTKQAGTQTAEVLAANPTSNIQSPPEYEQAWQLLDSALESWNSADAIAAERQLEQITKIVGNDVVFYENALKLLGDREEWLFAAMLITTPGAQLPAGLDQELIDIVHHALFMAASDERAGELLAQNAGDPLFAVADIRFQLYFGDWDSARTDLEALAQNEVISPSLSFFMVCLAKTI
ncbi:MAG: protein kinase, partial [Anaerolineaceae bacterium]|nr:protein kinase [Anaerolineaceae bacterium]